MTETHADPVAAFMAEAGHEVLDGINDTYPDSVLLIARILGGHRAATDARLSAIDAGGVDLVATVAGGDQGCRVAFAETLTEPDGLTVALLGLITRARTESGEPGVTSAERMMAEMSGIRTFLTRVVAVADVHAHLRLITFGGGDLATFAPLGPDTFLYVLLPPPGRAELTIDQSFTWEAHRTMPEAERPVGAYYTVRSWRPADAELDVLFVLHSATAPPPATQWHCGDRARRTTRRPAPTAGCWWPTRPGSPAWPPSWSRSRRAPPPPSSRRWPARRSTRTSPKARLSR
jgi:Siderophore-interacting FAD-binding domain